MPFAASWAISNHVRYFGIKPLLKEISESGSMAKGDSLESKTQTNEPCRNDDPRVLSNCKYANGHCVRALANLKTER